MIVLDHEPHWWFLLQEADDIYLDVNCSHSFIGYSFTIRLNQEEIIEYRRIGRAFAERVAREIQDSAPIMQASRSKYKGRNVSREYSEKIADAVARWRGE